MNMLTNKVPFGLLSENEKELFRNSICSCEYYTEAGTWNNWNSAGALTQDVVLRLKLNEGEWYKYGSTVVQCLTKDVGQGLYFTDGTIHIRTFAIDYTLQFRPATQAEIDSVKPQFKRGDVVASGETYSIMRFEQYCKQPEMFSRLSRLDSTCNEFVFDNDHGYLIELFELATPDQIKQLEREEMKHGKSWNGEGYDDWLTADGLTINEIIKHGIENIQVGGEKHDTEWRRTSHTYLDSVINEMLVFVKDYRLKPQESFVDVEIESWNKFGEPMFKMKEGFVLSGYVMEGGYHTNKPTKFQENGTVINERAVSARFVSLEQ